MCRGVRWLVLVVVALGGAALALTRLGPWLVVDDALARADVIIVLNGGEDHVRAAEAARLYREGWAGEVWLTQDPRAGADVSKAARGALTDGGTGSNVKDLVFGGVPRESIRIVPGGVRDTIEELRRVATDLRERRAHRVIVVTSRFHTRRARWLWWLAVGRTPAASVRGASTSSDLRGWLWNDEERLWVRREVTALCRDTVAARLTRR